MAVNEYISVGQMRSVVLFRQNTPVDNTSGGQDDSYADLLTTRGRLRKNRGSKNLEHGDIGFDKSYELICRAENALIINSDTICVINSEEYKINDWEIVDEIKHWIKFSISKR